MERDNRAHSEQLHRPLTLRARSDHLPWRKHVHRTDAMHDRARQCNRALAVSLNENDLRGLTTRTYLRKRVHGRTASGAFRTLLSRGVVWAACPLRLMRSTRHGSWVAGS